MSAPDCYADPVRLDSDTNDTARRLLYCRWRAWVHRANMPVLRLRARSLLLLGDLGLPLCGARRRSMRGKLSMRANGDPDAEPPYAYAWG